MGAAFLGTLVRPALPLLHHLMVKSENALPTRWGEISETSLCPVHLYQIRLCSDSPRFLVSRRRLDFLTKEKMQVNFAFPDPSRLWQILSVLIEGSFLTYLPKGKVECKSVPAQASSSWWKGKGGTRGMSRGPGQRTGGESGTPEVHLSLLASKSFSHLLSLIPTREERMCMCVFV